MSFKIEKGLLRDVMIIRPKVFFDSRGFFYESFNLNDFRNLLDNMVSEVDFSLAKHDFLLASG